MKNKKKNTQFKAFSGNEKTAQEYQGVANAFYKRNGIYDTVEPTDQNILNALTKDSEAGKSSGSFSKMKYAVEFDQRSKGKMKCAIKIRALDKPDIEDPNRTSKKVLKRVLKADFDKVISMAIEKDNHGLEAYLKLVKITGCRPSSVPGIKVLDQESGKIFIPARKQTKDGLRGADAIVYVNKLALARINNALEHLDQAKIDLNRKQMKKGVQLSSKELNLKLTNQASDSLNRFTEKLFPRRETQFSMKTLRHQKGSELKAEGMPPVEIAACLGHQSSASCSVYGDGRTKTTGKGGMTPDPSIVKQVRNDNPLNISVQEQIDNGKQAKSLREASENNVNQKNESSSDYDY